MSHFQIKIKEIKRIYVLCFGPFVNCYSSVHSLVFKKIPIKNKSRLTEKQKIKKYPAGKPLCN